MGMAVYSKNSGSELMLAEGQPAPQRFGSMLRGNPAMQASNGEQEQDR
jgi:hypothetical protein